MAESLHEEALKACYKLAHDALEAGDAPFGSVLLSSDGTIIKSDRNRTVTGEDGSGKPDATLHPEFTLARWAGLNLSPEERSKASVYTTGEHCPMCAAAHAYCGLGPIVYISSSEQYASWMKEAGVDAGNVAPLAINQVAPSISVTGPVSAWDEEVRKLHQRRWAAKKSGAGST